MIRRFRHRTLRALGLLASLLWAFTVGAGEVHRILVNHAVCAEHHEVVEAGGAAAHASTDADHHGPSASATTPHAEHGCAVGVLAPASAPPPFVFHRAPLRVRAPVEWFALTQPARGPPLEYAPKTSPPAVG